VSNQATVDGSPDSSGPPSSMVDVVVFPPLFCGNFYSQSENTLKKTAFLSIGIVFRSFETGTVR